MEGIIDKDYSTALLANLICADLLLIVTAVDGVYIDYNTKNEKKIDKISTIELEKLISEYDFGKGSMEPKLKAAINFVNKTDNIAIITNINDVEDAIKFKKGTIIIK
jgi:carbamate kinase